MEELKWKYIKPLKDEKSLDIIEEKFNFKIPIDLKECILKNNGGRPSRKVFDTDKSVERVIKTLLSYNENDIENIYRVLDIFKKEEIDLLPFAIDPSGNYICVDKENSVVLWNHETNIVEYIAKSFSEFLNRLYE